MALATLGDALMDHCDAGNDTNTITSTYSMFGMSGWILADKNDDATSGDGAIMFTDAPTNGSTSGTWGLSSILGFSKVAVSLKAGNGFGVFLVGMDSGTWSSNKDLSHASIYYIGGGGVIPGVPLPAGFPLMLSVLGVAGLVARRRKA